MTTSLKQRLCEKCGKEIEESRILYAERHGFTIRYCFWCSKEHSKRFHNDDYNPNYNHPPQ